MIRAQLVGATGYGGLGMVELLVGHPEIELVSLLAKNDVGQPISAFFPHLRGFCDLSRRGGHTGARRSGRRPRDLCDARPDRYGLCAGARGRGGRGARLQRRLPLSERRRVRAVRESAAVGGRAAAHLSQSCCRGRPTAFRSCSEATWPAARLVGNPGCFAVAIILGLAPALQGRIIDPQSVICDGKTGISGAGKKPGALYHFPDANDNVTAYRIAAHQHAVEAMIALERWCGSAARITFVPHLVPITRGIICTTYATISGDHTLERIHELYQAMYADEPFVRVMPLGVAPGSEGGRR